MELVERIKQVCKEKCTTMAALEKELGFGNGTIRRWNDKIPSADKLLLIANRLNKSVDWLLTGKESNLSQEEQKLIEYYRNTSADGKAIILDNAKITSNRLPQELESSISGIG